MCSGNVASVSDINKMTEYISAVDDIQYNQHSTHCQANWLLVSMLSTKYINCNSMLKLQWLIFLESGLYLTLTDIWNFFMTENTRD
jgi:hypothetical protein